MRQLLFILAIVTFGFSVAIANTVDFFDLQESDLNPEILQMIEENNSRLSRTSPVWDFGTTAVPVPLPRPGDPLFYEDTTWSKDFSPHITYSGTNPLFLFYNNPSQRFNITTDPVNPLILHFDVRPEMEHWYGTEVIIIGVSDTPTRDPNRNYATAVVRITVQPVDDPIILDCPPEFERYDEFGNLTHYVIEMEEDTELTIDFLNYQGRPLIKTVDDPTNPGNYEFFLTQTQQIPYNVEIIQTPAFTGKTVTFRPRPGFFGVVTFTITNVDNNINGFLEADPEFNTCLNVFEVHVSNVNDAPVIRETLPMPLTESLVQYQNMAFSARVFDEDDQFEGFVPPATEMDFEWRVTGSQYGTPLDIVIPHTLSADPANPLDVISSIDYTFDYPGDFQVSLVVSDDLVTLDPVVWNVQVMPAGPEFTLAGGTYTQSINVGLFSTLHPAAPIYYTLDGSLPDQSSMLFNPATPILISTSQDDVFVTITAVYYDDVYGQSGYTSQTYHVTGTVTDPVFNLSPLPDYYTSPQNLTISTSIAGASIRYTTDGTDPSPVYGDIYAGPINIPTFSTLSVKAIAYKDNWLTSGISEGSFRVTGQVRIDAISFDQQAAPYVNLVGVGQGLPIQITNLLLYPGDPDTRLYFTTDNTTPTEASTLYTNQTITITENTILRFRAFRDEWAPSAVSFFEFLVGGQVLIPSFAHGSVFSPDPSQIYTTEQVININSPEPAQSARIYYTSSDDLSIEPPDPTESSQLYLGGAQISLSPLQPYNVAYKRIKARAYHDAYAPSPVYEAGFTVTGKVQNPVFQTAGGAYLNPQLLEISTNAPGGQIRYTISSDPNNPPDDPSEFDNLYTGAISLPLGTRIVKARAYKDNWAPSDVVTAIYFIGLLEAPTFDPVETLHQAPIAVQISHPDPSAIIRWVEGTAIPSQTSPIYTGPIPISQSTTITARAFKQDWNPSVASTKSYTITGQLAPLHFILPNLPGAYENTVNVALGSDDPDVDIYYTTDGTVPSLTNGNLFSSPFAVSTTTLVRARAFKQDWLPSPVLDGLYEIVSTVAAPSFTPPAGIYTNPVNVFMYSATTNATIRYTTDGSDPSITLGTIFNPDNPVNISSNTTLKAIAYVSGGISSAISTGIYQITGTVATLSFTPPAGAYAEPQTVSISSTTPGVSIYYTLNGTEPDQTSILFDPLNPIVVNQSTVIKAVAYKTNWLPSAVATASYVINGRVATPIFSPSGGSYFEEQMVYISTYPEDAQIYYTTDGTVPTNDPALLYTPGTPITVNQSTSLRARAYKDQWVQSLVGSAVYTMNVLPPLVNNPSGIYPAPITVSLTNQNAGASIYYTLDGSMPTQIPANLYTGPITISNNTRLRAIAYRDNWTPSPEIDNSYVINPPITAPVFSVADGSILNGDFSLSITVSPTDATIYYTLDGSDPDQSSSVYSGPITITQNTLVKARAYKAIHNPSPISQAQYYIKTSNPTVNFAGGIYNNPVGISLSSPSPGSQIYYSLDGSVPDALSGTLYTVPFTIDTDTTLKAIAVKNNWLASDVIEHSYSFQTGAISFSPPAGSYPGDIAVQLSTNTTGATIHYTINDAAPTTTTGTVYSGPIMMSEPGIIRAIAFKDAMPPSSAEASYSFKLPVPMFSVSEGIYNQDFDLVLTSSIPTAEIYYTLDGSDPLTNGVLYAAPISISNPITVKAITRLAGWNDSNLNQASYQFKVATPVYNPAAGLYADPQNIEITTATSGATIYFTDDESIPDQSSTVYTAPVNVISGLFVFKAIATRPGWMNSDIGEAGYIIGSGSGSPANTVATPVLNPAPGNFTTSQTVSISSSTPSSTIRYTLDGTDPSPTNGMDYAGPFTLPLNSTTTVKAIAYRDGWTNSQMAAGTYIITGTVAGVQFTPTGGTFTAPQTVILSTSTEGATIRYTTDGTDPVANSTIYNSGIQLPTNSLTIIKARAFKSGWNPGPISSNTYNITGQVSINQPVFSIASGTYQTAQTVSVIGSPLPLDAVIRYTTDGNDPTEVSPIYSAPIAIGLNSNLTIKIRAYRTDWLPSPIYNASYTVTGAVQLAATPFDPLPGTYATAQTVSLMPASSPTDAVLRYTLNGTEPTELSPAYSNPISLPLGSTTTIKVKGFKADWTASDTVTGVYTITGQITFNTPVFTPAAGVYQTAQSISINNTTPAAAVYYTTDGTEPTEASSLYTGPIDLPLDSSLTLKTKAFLANWTPSVTHTAVYSTTGQVSLSMPVFSPNPGLYTSSQLVSIVAIPDPADAVLHYTTDGSNPSTSSPVYSGPIPVNSGETLNLRVRAFATNWLPSDIYSASYTVTGTVSLPDPLFNPAPGIYTGAQTVTLNTATSPAGAILRYTTDGTEPTEASPVYSSAILISDDTTIKVKAFLADWIPSATVSGTYTITGQVTISTPVFNIPSGTYQTAQTVSVIGSPSPADAVIRYTTDGSDPTASSPIYASPFSIGLNSSLTIKLRAFRTDWLPSPIYTATYTVTGTVALPGVVFTPPAGTYQTAQSITLNTATTPAGATLRYTTDGSEPGLLSPAYTAPIALGLNSTTTIKVKAFLDDWTPSTTVSATYLITGTLAINAPVFDPPAGLYYQAQTVTVNSASQAGAVIRYTLDGSDPTTGSPVYSTALQIPQGNTSLKVRAFLANWTSSPIYTANYQITGQVALPTPFFSPAPGTYTTAQQVTLNQATVPAGAQIRYTTDGSIPNATSTLYTGPISVNLNTIRTIRAVAYLNDWLPSEVASATYTVTGQAAINGTVFTPAAGLYTTPISVSLNTATTPAGATLRYTIDGTEPTTESPEYTAAIPLMGDMTTTVKVKVYATGWIPSETYEATYVITGRVYVGGDLFDPPAGTYTTAQSVSITAEIYPIPDEIRYTIDGTEPTDTSPVYSGPIDIPLNTQGFEIRAKAYLVNWIPSPTFSAIYNVTGQVTLDSPAISPAPGTYTSAQTITIAAPVLPQAADIRYTLDGSEPTLTSPAYQSPFQIPGNAVTTVKLKGFSTDWIPSPTVTAVYNITGTVADPVFSMEGGLYAESFDLVLSTATADAEIRYTTDGSEPDQSSTLYTEPIPIPDQSQNLVIKARAFKTDWISSQTVSNSYSVLLVPIDIRAYSYSGYIRVLWNSPLPSRSLDGFNLYRKATGEATFSKVNTTGLINTFDAGFYYYDDYIIQTNSSYSYYVTAVYNGMESPASQTTSIQYQAGDLEINANSHAYPNPAINATTIKLVLSRNDNVQISVTVYDFAGKQIRTLTVPATNTNLIEIPWDLKNSSGTKVARGTYFARIVAIDGANRSERILKIAVQ